MKITFPNMKKIFTSLVFVFIISFSAFSQEKNWAFGARIGEPAGLNIRKYMNEHALDINIGSYGGLWGKNRNYRKGQYKNMGLAVNVNYLWHGNLFKSETAKYYYGFGAQFNNRKYYPTDQKLAQGVASLSVGGNATAGLEFFLKDSPLSIFAETGTYIEVLPATLFWHVQGGAGVKYNF
jgi:hypothetical protein